MGKACTAHSGCGGEAPTGLGGGSPLQPCPPPQAAVPQGVGAVAGNLVFLVRLPCLQGNVEVAGMDHSHRQVGVDSPHLALTRASLHNQARNQTYSGPGLSWVLR